MAASMSTISTEFLTSTMHGSVKRIGFLMGRIPQRATCMRIARQMTVPTIVHQKTNSLLPFQHGRCLFHSVSSLSSQLEDVAVDDTDAEDSAAMDELGMELKPKGYMAAKPVDDVYLTYHYPPQLVTFQEAMEKLRYQDKWAYCRKPELYRDRTVTISMHLDMVMEKKKKVVAFQNMVILPHPFKQENKVLCFAEGTDAQIALDAGAYLVGGEETIQDILDHRIHHRSFDYCVATPDMMGSLTKLKEKLRKRFPASKRGSVSSNIPAMLNLYRKGQEYKVQTKHNTINCPIGKLSLSNEQLEENMCAIISDVSSHKPLQFGPIIKKLSVVAFMLDGHQIHFKEYLPVSNEEEKLKEELERLEENK